MRFSWDSHENGSRFFLLLLTSIYVVKYWIWCRWMRLSLLIMNLCFDFRLLRFSRRTLTRTRCTFSSQILMRISWELFDSHENSWEFVRIRENSWELVRTRENFRFSWELVRTRENSLETNRKGEKQTGKGVKSVDAKREGEVKVKSNY